MRKGLIFKKGIIIALAATMVTSLAPALGASGRGVINAKAEETTTGIIPKYLKMGLISIIDNGELQDDGISGNDDTIYQGTNWYYDITNNQLVLDSASISGNILSMDGDLAIILSGENTMNSREMIQSVLMDGQIEHTLEINGNNYNGSLSCGIINTGNYSSTNNNLKIIGATLETLGIDCGDGLTIQNSHIVVNNADKSDAISGKDINITNSYVDAKTINTYGYGKAIDSDQKISVSDSQIVAESSVDSEENILSDCDFNNSIITKKWRDADTGDDVTKTYVYGTAALKEDLTIASGESIEFDSSASITNLDKLIVEDGATILTDGAEHKHNTNGDITYIWQDDKEHIKGVACKDCPIGYVTKETEAHNYNVHGFCIECDAYQPAALTIDKYDIDGDDSKDAVYEISNAGQLYWFAGLVNGTLTGVDQNTSANAVLTADIVVNENVLKSDGTLNDGTFKEWAPIGTGETSPNAYTGTFDGRNYTISGLYFNQENSYDIGLFGCNSGKIANAGILDSYFYGTSNVGGVSGYNDGGTITNCYNTGSVSGIGSVGGVSGYNYTGRITDCYNTGNVSGSQDFVGGVNGRNKGAIINCYNSGSVSGNGNVGGVNGINYTGSITDCYNIGSVSGSEDNVGGVNGYNDGGTITNSYNAGSVSGTERYVGGVNGCNKGSITNCYNAGSVSGTGYVGGVSGENYGGTITNCYYDSTIYTGNAIGKNSSGTAIKVEGETTDEFKTGEVAYLLQADESQSDEAWGQTIGTDTYPVLRGAKVYKNAIYSGCNELSDAISAEYSNEKKNDVFGDHYFEDGVCKYCDQEVAVTVTKENETKSFVSLQDAIDYAENMPGSVVTVMSDTEYKTCYVNNPDSDFTIDINGNNVDGVTVKNGKITIIDSKANGEMQGNLVVNKESIVTLGDVEISSATKVYGQLILNGGNLESIDFYEDNAKVFFNNSDIKINNYIYWNNEYFEGLIINAEPHNIIPTFINGARLDENTSLARGGDNITLEADWFNVSAGFVELDSTARIAENKLIVGALINDKVKTAFEEGETFTYSGSELKPTVRVYINRVVMADEKLIENKDYIVSYSDNINTGTATVTITGIGAYSGSKNITFTIEPKKIDNPTFAGLKSEYTYIGKAIEPEFTLMDGDTVIPSSEYEVIYSDNTEVGTATVTIKDAAGGNYDINCNAEFDIVKIDTVINELPVADAVSYDPVKTLDDIKLSGGDVLDPLGKSIPGSWDWADDSVVPTVDNSGYEVIFTPDDQTHYNSVMGTIQVNVAKADIKIFELPMATGISYGDDLAKSVIVGGLALLDGINESVVSGTFSWKDDSIKPFVSDSDKTLYTIVFTPYDTVNYNTAESEITVNVSRAAMPNLVMNVDNSYKTVGSIALPGDWTWFDNHVDTVIKAGGSVETLAVYTGDDKDNYYSTTLKITIYRAPCSEGKTVKYTLTGEKAPTCTKAGTGHTECSICGDVISTNVSVQPLGHTWNSGRVTKKPTYTATGVKTYTCTVCKAAKTGSIAKLPTTNISKKANKITVSGIENKIYNGRTHTQKSLVVKAGTKTLKLGTDYTVTYSNNKVVGKATMVIRGKNAYSGKITRTFAINKAAKGKTYTVDKFKYTITDARTNGLGTVSLAGTTYTRSDKKFTSVTIGDTVTIGDVRFKITSVGANAFSRYTVLKSVTIGANVTSIGANAFLSCKNLRTVNIKSTKLVKVGTKAFYGTYSKITFVMPKSKTVSYKKLIKNSSPSANAIYK